MNQSLAQQHLSSVSIHSINPDTGTTGTFIALSDASVLLNIRPTIDGISFALPDNQVIISTHTATLNLPTLPMAVHEAQKFSYTKGLSTTIHGMLTDAGLTAIYNADAMSILNATGGTVLSGTRSPSTRL